MYPALFRFTRRTLLLCAVATSLSVPAVSAEDEYVTTSSGLRFRITQRGDGASPQPGNVIIAHYVGTFPDGKVFDSSRERDDPFAFTLSRPADAEGRGEIKRQVIAGWDEAFRLLRVGDRATLVIKPELAYGDKQRGDIPANSTLHFDVELLAIKERALSDWLRERIDAVGADQAMQETQALRAKGWGEYHVSEAQLNGLGYRYLAKKGSAPDATHDPAALAAAVAVLELNAALFPNSANVHDSLGEALLEAGRKEEGLKSYRRSLELDPKNENAKKVLERESRAGI